MIKKKYVLTFMSAIMSLGLLFGCADNDNNNAPVNDDPAVNEEAPGGNNDNMEEPENDAPTNDDAPADNDTPATP